MRSRLCQVVNTLSPRAPRQLVTRSILPNLSVRANSHLPSPRYLRTSSHVWTDVDLTEPRNSGLGHRTDDSTRNNTRLAVLSDEEFAILAGLFLSEVQEFANMAETLREIRENKRLDEMSNVGTETTQTMGKSLEFATDLTDDRLTISTLAVGPYILEIHYPGQQIVFTSPSSNIRYFSYVTGFSRRENWDGQDVEEDGCKDGDSDIFRDGKWLDRTNGTSLADLLRAELELEVPVVFEPGETLSIPVVSFG